MSEDPMRAKARATFGKGFMDAAKPKPLAKNAAVASQKVANSRPIPTYKDGGSITAERVAARMAAGNYAGGGKIQTSADTARKLATEMGGMTPVKKAVGGTGKTRKGMAPIKRAEGGVAKKRPEDEEPIAKPMSAAEIAKAVGTTPVPRAEASSFSEAFREARKEKGAGSTFTWRGKSYSTNLAEEAKKPSAPAPRAQAPAARAEPAPAPKAAPKPAAPAPRAQAPAPRPTAAPARETALDRMRAAAEAPDASRYAKDRYKFAQQSNMYAGARPPAGRDRAKKLDELRAAAEAPGASRLAKDRYRMARQSGMYAEGGVAKKRDTMPREPISTRPTTPDGRRITIEELNASNKPEPAPKPKPPKPVRRAKGGAGKVRKGMMTQEGNIKQAVKPKKGIGGYM